MRNSIFLLIFLLICSCNIKSKSIAEIELIKVKNFGTIKVGDTVNSTFYVKNTSEIPLKIINIKTSCGCTVAKIQDSIIARKSDSKIITQYIAESDDIGLIEKSIVVEANTNPVFTVLYLKGIVTK
jgi:hypothetical protein